MLIAFKKICWLPNDHSRLYINDMMYVQVDLFTAQNMFHLEFNFSLLILDNISTEAVGSVVSMVFMTLPSFLRRLSISISAGCFVTK